MAGSRDDESEGVFPDEYDGPTVSIPDVDAPEVDVPTLDSDSLTDSPLAALFILHVVVWNAALLCFALGAMLIYFRGNLATGGQLIGLGAVLTFYGMYRWPNGGDWV